MLNKKLAQSFAILTGSVALTQLILVVSSPILTRLYTPEDFGNLAIYMSILGILTVISSFRYELALPASVNSKEEINLLFLSFLIIAINFIILILFTYFFLDDLLSLLNQKYLVPYKWLIPFGFLFMGIYRISVQLATKQKRYKDIAKTKISQSMGMVGIQILFFKLGAFALLLGHIIGQSLGVIRILFSSEILKNIRSHVSRKSILEVAFKYKNFPKFSLPSALLNVVGAQLPIIMLSSLFSPAIAGFYALAQRIIFLPVTMLTGSIVSIIFGEGRNLKNNNQLEKKIWDIHKVLSFIALPIAIAVFLVMPDIFRIIFGDRWEMAGSFAALLMPWFFLVFTMTPVFDTFEAFYNQRIVMFFQLFLSIGRVGAIFLGYLQADIYKSILYFSIISVVVFLAFFLIILKEINIRLIEIVKFYISKLFIIIIVLMPLFIQFFYKIDYGFIKWFTFIPAITISIYFIGKNLSFLKRN